MSVVLDLHYAEASATLIVDKHISDADDVIELQLLQALRLADEPTSRLVVARCAQRKQLQCYALAIRRSTTDDAKPRGRWTRRKDSVIAKHMEAPDVGDAVSTGAKLQLWPTSRSK
jgi:hypothetical protein